MLGDPFQSPTPEALSAWYMLPFSEACRRGWGLADLFSLTSPTDLAGLEDAVGCMVLQGGPWTPTHLLHLMRHNHAAALAEGEQGWGRCENCSQAVLWSPHVILCPGAPSSRSWQPP